MTTFASFPMVWNGEALAPKGQYWQRKADERFIIGQEYLIEEHLERSAATHRHFFAQLKEAWDNMPETVTEFPTVEHLRKRALIETGFRNERAIVCSSPAEAERFAAFIRPLDEFAVISVNGCAVVEWRAKSQSQRDMDRAEFQASKTAVLAWAWDLVGVSPEEGAANAGQAA